MATTAATRHVATGAVDVGVEFPDEREYETEADAALDRHLVSAIEAAEDAGNTSLAQLLAYELGSHYFSTR